MVLATIPTREGQNGVQADFGGVGALVLALGACASDENSSRHYVRNLAKEAKQAILDALKDR